MSHADTLTDTRPVTPASGRNDTPGGTPAQWSRPFWLPAVVIGLLVSGLTVLGWRALLQQQQQTIAEVTQAAAVQVTNEMRARLDARLQALTRMGRRWDIGGRPTAAVWEADVMSYLRDFPSIQAIAWADASLHIQWILPFADNEAALGMDINAAPGQSAQQQARERRTVMLSPSVILRQGGRGFIAYVPLFPQNTFDGFLEGVFRVQPFFDTVLADIAPGYGVVVFEDTTELYRRAPPAETARMGPAHETTITLPGVTWRVQVWPGAAVRAQHHTDLPHALLFMGLVLAGALSLLVWQAQRLRQELHDRQQAAHTLRLQTQMLEMLGEGVGVATWDNTLVYTNPAFDAMFGYERGALLGENGAVLNDYTPEENAQFWTELQQHVQQHGLWRGTIHNHRKDGTPFVSNIRTTLLVTDDQRYLVGVQEDVTERTQLEAELAKSEARFRHMVQHAPIGIALADLEGHFLSVNPALCTLLGYTEAELLARTWVELTHPDDLPATLYAEEQLVRSAAPYCLEKRYLTKAGDSVWINLTVALVRDEQGRLLHEIGMIEDITARKQAEDALRSLNATLEQRIHERTAALQESEARFRLLADSAPVLIWVNSLQGCEFVNQSYLRFLGVHAEADVRGYDWTPFIHPEDRDAYVNGYLEALAQRRRFAAQFRFRRHDGVYRWMHSIGLPRYGSQGDCLGYVGSTYDITDLQEAQETLAQQARDLAHAHADLRQVAYVSAHDLQEPIRQIGIYTQHIAKQYGATMDADMQDAIAFIVEGTKRMQAQFTDLMHYLEMEDPGTGITPTDCENVFRQALDQLHEPIMTSGATITHDPLPTLAANAKHLQLVFQELLDNAMKFRNGTPPQVHVWAEREEHGWRFAVRDNGIGIAQEGLHQLFGFFRKLQQRQAYPGTGMGLAICKKIVERHGGRIWIDSTPGTGTTIYFTVSNAGGGGERTDE